VNEFHKKTAEELQQIMETKKLDSTVYSAVLREFQRRSAVATEKTAKYTFCIMIATFLTLLAMVAFNMYTISHPITP
jgi:hypothetical protein